MGGLRFVLRPLLLPALIASAVIALDFSIDNFVISYWLSCGTGWRHRARGHLQRHSPQSQPTHHALALLTVAVTLLILATGFLLYRHSSRGGTPANADLDLGAGLP